MTAGVKRKAIFTNWSVLATKNNLPTQKIQNHTEVVAACSWESKRKLLSLCERDFEDGRFLAER